MALRCKDCKHDKGRCVGSSRQGSHQYCFEAKVMTNADRIRAMSDEEMRAFLCSITECGICEWCGLDGCGLSNWLQKPAGGA